MFNVGIIASCRAAPALKLSDRLLEAFSYDVGGYYEHEFSVGIKSDGRVQYSRAYGYSYVAGEYRVGGALSGFGSGYEVRYTLQGGTTPSGPTGWNSLAVDRVFYWLADSADSTWTGRILIEIRDAVTKTVLASARFAGPGFKNW